MGTKKEMLKDAAEFKETEGANLPDTIGYEQTVNNAAGLGLSKKWLEVMKAVAYMQRERVKGLPYPTISYSDVIEKVRPKIIELGLLLVPYVKSSESLVHREERVNDKTGEIFHKNIFITKSIVGYHIICTDTGETMQTEGICNGMAFDANDASKAYTGALKNSLTKSLCLITGDDTEEVWDKKNNPVEKSLPIKNPEEAKKLKKEETEKMNAALTPIGDAKAKELWQLAKKAEVDPQVITSAFNVDSLPELSLEKYELAKARLVNILNEREKAEDIQANKDA